MNDRIEKLKIQGKLRVEKVGFIQIEGLLKDAVRDIREAQAVVSALHDAEKWIQAIGEKVKLRNPQFDLPFD